MLAIQVVTVHWSKASRPGPAATQRNQIPRAFALQRHGGSFNVIQRHAFHETAGGEFESRPVTCGQPPAPLPSTSIEGLLIDGDADGLLAIGFSWNKTVHGMPNRGHKRRLIFLAPGERAQLRVNGRHSGYVHWYTQHTFNVARGPGLDENVFLDRPFSHACSLEANLF